MNYWKISLGAIVLILVLGGLFLATAKAFGLDHAAGLWALGGVTALCLLFGIFSIIDGIWPE